MKFITKTDVQTGEEVKLSYCDYGSGQPIILIHGWPLCKEMWEYQISALVGAGYRVIKYDRRGFGKSSKPWSGYDYDTLTDDLKAIIDDLKLENFILIGFSMGGGEVARYFTKYNGQGVSKAVLIGSVTPKLIKAEDNPDGAPQEVIDGMLEGIKNDRIAFLDDFGKQFFGVNLINHPVSTSFLEYYRALGSMAAPQATLECVKSFAYTDFSSDLAAITVPTLLIHGDADKTVPIAATANKAAQMIKNCEYKMYDGAPHGLFYTHKEKLNEDLLTFLKG